MNKINFFFFYLYTHQTFESQFVSQIPQKYIRHDFYILEWFLKDYVTLKTGVMMLKIQIWSQTSITA